MTPRPGVTALPFDGGLVLLDGAADRLLVYNASAALVWRALAAGDDAALHLQQEYGVPREQATRDASIVVGEWQRLGLLSSDPGRGAEDPVGADLALPAGAFAGAGRTPATARRPIYRIGEACLAISADDATVAARLEALFEPFRADAAADAAIDLVRPAGGRGFVVTLDGAPVVEVGSAAEATGAVFQTVLGCLYRGTEWLAIVHGGALSTADRAVLLSGESGAGKSTLGAFLYSRGFEPLCDDMAAVTADGTLASWPVPISVKAGSWKALAPHLPALESITSESVHGKTTKLLPVATASWVPHVRPVGAIVFPRFEPATARASLVALRPLEVLRRLVADRVWLGHPLTPASVERFLAWLGRVPSYELSYGSFDRVERHVRQAVLG